MTLFRRTFRETILALFPNCRNSTPPVAHPPLWVYLAYQCPWKDSCTLGALGIKRTVFCICLATWYWHTNELSGDFRHRLFLCSFQNSRFPYRNSLASQLAEILASRFSSSSMISSFKIFPRFPSRQWTVETVEPWTCEDTWHPLLWKTYSWRITFAWELLPSTSRSFLLASLYLCPAAGS